MKGLDNYITSGNYYKYTDTVTCSCGHVQDVECCHEYGAHMFTNEEVKCENCGAYLIDSEIVK